MINNTVVSLEGLQLECSDHQIQWGDPLERSLNRIKESCHSTQLVLIGKGDQLKEAYDHHLGLCIDIGGNGGHFHVKENDLENLLKRMDVYFSMLRNALRAKKKHQALVIGINGVDASGKSFMANEMNVYYRALGHKTQLVHVDDFHNESKVRYSGSDPIMSYYNHAFNYQKLMI